MHVLTPFFSKKCRVLDKNQLNMLILVLQLLFFNVKAQPNSSKADMPPSQDDASRFQPSLAVVIGLLLIMFSLTFLLVLYAKFCHRVLSVDRNSTRVLDGLPRSTSRFSGINKNVIESLPFFRFSSLKGSRGGLECAVCLSKFEDIEILRLLPKCRHAFHVSCIDQWLEKHSSCPLCRHKVSADDLSFLRDSSSLRYLWNQSETREESNLELYVEREEDHREKSSRFSIGSSFRKSGKGKKEEELPIQQTSDTDEDGKVLHKFNHKITVSDVVLKNRWSNVSSSDLLFLSSEMIIDVSSDRFASFDASSEQTTATKASKDREIVNIKEDMGRKRLFESKFSSKIKENDSVPFPVLPIVASESNESSSSRRKIPNPTGKRSMSEITIHPRFAELNMNNNGKESSLPGNNIREQRTRRLWLPIASRTIQWFASRQRASLKIQNTTESSNV